MTPVPKNLTKKQTLAWRRAIIAGTGAGPRATALAKKSWGYRRTS